jgi:hypothetical protein
MTLQDRIMAQVREATSATYLGLASVLDEPRGRLDHALTGLLREGALIRFDGQYQIPGTPAAPVQFLDPPMKVKRKPKAKKRCVVCQQERESRQFYFKHTTCKRCLRTLAAQRAKQKVDPDALIVTSNSDAGNQRRSRSSKRGDDRRDAGPDLDL